jgi:protoporphyrinogen IX oxidase
MMLEMAGLGGLYLWVKALHVIVVIFWMAGLFMMPRFFAYHHETGAGSVEDLAWRERERRLLRIILTPSMLLTWLFGLTLAFQIGWDSGAWLYVKLALVIGLSALHGLCVGWWKKFARGERPLSSKAFRMINEIPTLATIPIVILVIVKPF